MGLVSVTVKLPHAVNMADGRQFVMASGRAQVPEEVADHPWCKLHCEAPDDNPVPVWERSPSPGPIELDPTPVLQPVPLPADADASATDDASADPAAAVDDVSIPPQGGKRAKR